MDVLTYIMIAACYGIGCRLSYKLGHWNGRIYAVKNMAQVIAIAITGTEQQGLSILKDYQKKAKAKQALKANGA